MANVYRGSAPGRSGLDGAPPARDGRVAAAAGATMEAVYAIAIFVIAMLVLNRFEFGRFD
jgi:hypothetical protein